MTLSYESAIRLGIIDVKTGKYCHPFDDEQMTLKEACERGYIDRNEVAVRDLRNG